MNKNRLVIYLIALGVGLLVLSAWAIGMFDPLENMSLDNRFRIRGPIEPSKEIVIVAFDEESFTHLGRWPWDRAHHGKLIDNLTLVGAKAIVFDMLLLEEDKRNPASDAYFVRSCKKAGNVIVASYFQYDDNGKPINFLEPIKNVKDAAIAGFSNIFPELDGVCRKAPVYKVYNNTILPSISLAALSKYFDKDTLEILADKNIQTDKYDEVLLNFAGEYGSFPYYPFYKVLNNQINKSDFKNKIVLVGGTASGLFDFKPIAFAPNFPGVEVHANLISNILLKNYLRPIASVWTGILIMLFALLPGFALYKLSPIKSGTIFFLILCFFSLVVYFLFASKNVYAEFAAPVFSLLLSYGSILLYRFITEEKEKRWIKHTFSRYLSSTIMESILSNPDNLKLGGERKDLTVLFSDIRDFTTISESLNPEEVVELLNEYLSKMVDVVFKYDGTLDKFIGDAIMVFWGAPIAQKDHAKKAVLCAVEMIEELKKLQKKWLSEGKKNLDIGIGINTGEMIVGNMGSKDKMEYTVIGDNVNLGSRLENLNKEYKTNILISEATQNLVKELVKTKYLGEVKIKGKTKPVKIYQVEAKK
ncbi:CHASE2 domain-containing protein [Elusimicrobiota bacterium]